MKKVAIPGLMIALVLIIATAALYAAPATTGNKVLYVTRTTSGELHPHDVVVKARLEKLGYVVTILEAKPATGEEGKDYDFIFISEANDSKQIKAKFLLSGKPQIICESYVADDMGFTGPAAEVDNGKVEYVYDSLSIVNPSHPLAAGLTGKVKIFKEAGTVGFGVPGGDAKIIAVATDDPKMALIYTYEKGAKNKLGEVLSSRITMFFMFEGNEDIMTEDGWKLFDAAVKYTFAK